MKCNTTNQLVHPVTQLMENNNQFDLEISRPFHEQNEEILYKLTTDQNASCPNNHINDGNDETKRNNLLSEDSILRSYSTSANDSIYIIRNRLKQSAFISG